MVPSLSAPAQYHITKPMEPSVVCAHLRLLRIYKYAQSEYGNTERYVLSSRWKQRSISLYLYNYKIKRHYVSYRFVAQSYFFST